MTPSYESNQLDDDRIDNDLVLARTVSVTPVVAPFEYVDIEAWLQSRTPLRRPQPFDPRRARSGHAAEPFTFSGVDLVGTQLTVQWHRFEVIGKYYCRIASLSDVLSPAGWVTTQIVWELRMDQVDGDDLRYVNTVTVHPSAGFLSLLAAQGRTFTQAAAALRAAGPYCELETPTYAEGIAHHARRARAAAAA